MKSKLLMLLLLVTGSVFAGPRFFVGVDVGVAAPYYVAPVSAPPVLVAYRPPCPGPGYVWVNGYYYPVGPRYGWRDGYWARRPFVGAYWVAPRYERYGYRAGYWGRR